MLSIMESLLASEPSLQVLRFFLGSSMLLGGALLIDKLRLLRRLSQLSWLWHGVLAGSLLLLVPLYNPAGFTLLFRSAAPPAATTDLEITAEVATHPANVLVPANANMPVLQMALILWVLVSAILLLRLLRVTQHEYASLGTRVPVGMQTPLYDEFARLSRNLGIRRTPRLTVSDSIVSAVTLPLREVCLPTELAQRNPASIRAVLAHELSHIKQCDIPRLIALQVLCAVFFFQPLIRVARDRLADIAEFQADLRAVEQCDAPEELARALLACANSIADRKRSAMCYSMHGHPSRLRARIELIMSNGSFSSQRAGRLSCFLIVIAILGLVGFSPGFIRGPALLAVQSVPLHSLRSCDNHHYELIVEAVHKGRVSGADGLDLWELHCGTESGDIVDIAGKQYGLAGHHLWYMAKVKPMDDPYLSEIFRLGNAMELSLFRNSHTQLSLPAEISPTVENAR